MPECLKLKKSNCKNCYKCIRNCPVKSIRFSAGQANIVPEECILCGRLEDAPLEDQTALNAQAAAATGYRCVEHEIVFRGICPACAGKQH